MDEAQSSLGNQASKLSQFVISQRLKHRLTVRELAATCGVSPSMISRIEVHGDIPKLEVLHSISNAFDVSIWEIWSYIYPEDMAEVLEIVQAYKGLSAKGKQQLLKLAQSLGEELGGVTT